MQVLRSEIQKILPLPSVRSPPAEGSSATTSPAADCCKLLHERYRERRTRKSVEEKREGTTRSISTSSASSHAASATGIRLQSLATSRAALRLVPAAVHVPQTTDQWAVCRTHHEQRTTTSVIINIFSSYSVRVGDTQTTMDFSSPLSSATSSSVAALWSSGSVGFLPMNKPAAAGERCARGAEPAAHDTLTN